MVCVAGSSGHKKKRARKKETREGRGSARKEGPRKSFPDPNLITWRPWRDLSKVLEENDWPRTNKACRQK